MQTNKLGQIAVVLGFLTLLYGMVMAAWIIPNEWILGISAGGALRGAITFLLLGIALFLWPKKE